MVPLPEVMVKTIPGSQLAPKTMKFNKAAIKVNRESAKTLYRLFQILQLLLCIMLPRPKQVISINPICKSLVWLIKIEGAKWGKCKTASNAQRSTFVFSPFSFYTLGAGKKIAISRLSMYFERMRKFLIICIV